MNYYLIDYENVGTQGLNGVNKLTEDDIICIFYSENADTLTFGLHRRLNESKANILYQKVEVGQKNALDFQLSSYLGYLLRENMEKQCNYFIVSHDKGYEVLINYWKRRRFDISLVIDVSRQSETTDSKQIPPIASVQDKQADLPKLTQQVSDLLGNESDAPLIAKMIQHYKTKQGLNNALTKHFKDTKKVGEIFAAIKPLIADKKGK